MFNHTILPNFHVLTVKYIGQTNTQPSKVKIISERFKQALTFDYKDTGNTLDQAEQWLIDNGHGVLGHAEGKGHYYVICQAINGSFKPLK